MKFKRILVGIDRSAQADAVFQKALYLAQDEGANLKIFHCISVSPMPVGSSTDLYGDRLRNASQTQTDLLQQEIEEVEDWLQKYLRQARAFEVPTELEYQVGSPAFWIREIARNWHADLVVMGRRGRSHLAELVLGSVSSHVIHNTQCSVLIVQGEEFEA